MKDNYILTAESVTEGHPDKLCDTIADAVVDACLKHDPSARVACEVMATAGKITAAGEITAVKLPDIPSIICKTVQRAGYGGSDYEVEVITHEQSLDIAGAVKGTQDTGAGDQGIVYGYACDETPEFLPLPVVFAHRLTRMLSHVRVLGIVPELRPDGKSQVSVEYEHGRPRRIAAVVLSCQHEEDADLDALRRDLTQYVILPSLRELPPDERTEILINPSGRFVEGGFEADTGLTGRKLMVDTYGGLAPHGGGALSGKDGTKVDRSGAYMARYVAKNVVAAGIAKECTVSLAYAIGKAQPVMVEVDTHGTGKFRLVCLSSQRCGLRLAASGHWAVSVHVSGANAGMGAGRPEAGVYLCSAAGRCGKEHRVCPAEGPGGVRRRRYPHLSASAVSAHHGPKTPGTGQKSQGDVPAAFGVLPAAQCLRTHLDR